MGAERAAKLARAEAALFVLREYRARFPTHAAYEADPRAQDIVERNVQVVVQCVIDLADALVTEMKWGRPTTAGEAVELLVRHRALPRSLGTSLQRWIRLRNVVVHEYAAIDNTRVHRAVRDRLKELRRGLTRLARFR